MVLKRVVTQAVQAGRHTGFAVRQTDTAHLGQAQIGAKTEVQRHANKVAVFPDRAETVVNHRAGAAAACQPEGDICARASNAHLSVKP